MLKRIALVIALSLPLAACEPPAFVTLFSAISEAQEPASINTQYEAEAMVFIIRRPVAEYFRLRQCRASETASLFNPCARYSIKVRLQNANRRVNVALLRFRSDPTALTAIRAAVTEYRNVVDANRATIATVGVK